MWARFDSGGSHACKLNQLDLSQFHSVSRNPSKDSTIVRDPTRMFKCLGLPSPSVIVENLIPLCIFVSQIISGIFLRQMPVARET